MKKNVTYLMLFLFPIIAYSQVDKEYESRSLKDNFKITNIDSTNYYYLISAIDDNNFQVLLLQKKLSRKEHKNLLKKTNVDKIAVGKFYYLNLENWFYNFAVYGSANDRIVIDKRIIYEKDKSPYYVYETKDLKGLFINKP